MALSFPAFDVCAARLQLRGVEFRFPEEQRLAVACNDLEVRPGEFFGLVGLSGSGKTTLLRLIAGLLSPSAGSISCSGAAPDRTVITSMMFQHSALLPWRSVLRNVTLPLEIAGKRSGAKSRAEALLAELDMSGLESRWPSELSGGQQQRVSLARALIVMPGLLLLDEPFSSVDELTKRTLHKYLLKLWTETKCTVLFVTHNLADALLLSDRVGLLRGVPGHFCGTVESPFPRPRPEDLRYSAKLLSLEAELGRAMEAT